MSAPSTWARSTARETSSPPGTPRSSSSWSITSKGPDTSGTSPACRKGKRCATWVCGAGPTPPLPHGFITAALLEEIERRCVTWRWRLKGRTDRLRQVHGDYHPFNILFREGGDFTVLA